MKHIAAGLMLFLVHSLAWGSSPYDQAMRSRFEEVQGAANYLLVVTEGSVEEKRASLLKCDPTAEKAQAWMSGPMHALADAKQAAELKIYEKHPNLYRHRIEACAKTCSCNGFSALLESASDKTKATKAHAENLRLVTPLAEKEDQSKSVACAKAFKSFCGSAIEKYLKSEN